MNIYIKFSRLEHRFSSTFWASGLVMSETGHDMKRNLEFCLYGLRNKVSLTRTAITESKIQKQILSVMQENTPKELVFLRDVGHHSSPWAAITRQMFAPVSGHLRRCQVSSCTCGSTTLSRVHDPLPRFQKTRPGFEAHSGGPIPLAAE